MRRMAGEAAEDYSNLTALFINTTLTRSPGVSHTQRLVDTSAAIMTTQGVRVDQLRSVDHPIATGVYPDMREHGWTIDAWPEIAARVLAADILVIAGPIWLGFVIGPMPIAPCARAKPARSGGGSSMRCPIHLRSTGRLRMTAMRS